MKDGEYPYTVRFDVWFNTLCLFMPLVTFNQKKRTLEEHFMHFIAANFNHTYQFIDADALIGIIDWIDFDSLTTEEIINITSKKFIIDYVKEVQEAREQGKEPREDIKKIKAITKEVGKIQEKKIESLTNEVTELKSFMQQKDTIIMIKDNIIKKFKNYFFVAVLLLLIITDSMLYLTLGLTIEILAIVIGVELAFLFGIPSIRNWIRESVS